MQRGSPKVAGIQHILITSDGKTETLGERRLGGGEKRENSVVLLNDGRLLHMVSHDVGQACSICEGKIVLRPGVITDKDDEIIAICSQDCDSIR